MKVVLLENLVSLGVKGDIKEVSDGYATNFLLPQGKVALATESNVARLKARDNKAQAEQQGRQDNYAKLAKSLNKQSLSFAGKASDKSTLFQGISGQDIVREVKAKFNLDISDKWFVKSVLLKEVGRHNVHLRLPDNTLISLFININPVK